MLACIFNCWMKYKQNILHSLWSEPFLIKHWLAEVADHFWSQFIREETTQCWNDMFFERRMVLRVCRVTDAELVGLQPFLTVVAKWLAREFSTGSNEKRCLLFCLFDPCLCLRVAFSIAEPVYQFSVWISPFVVSGLPSPISPFEYIFAGSHGYILPFCD